MGAVRAPWGWWSMNPTGKTGEWHHNPALSMTAAEQRAANEANGFECPGHDGTNHG
jgi:aryl-phospho-beta-D-glucosidase BglC (GH1 family)